MTDTNYQEQMEKDRQEAAAWSQGHWKELQQLWVDLHIYAARFSLSPSTEDVDDAESWLQQWYVKFPPDCPCIAEWTRILEVCPPPIASGALEFFWWTVAAHDRVNVYLGKRVWANKSKTHPLLQQLLETDEGSRAEYKRRMSAPAINKC